MFCFRARSPSTETRGEHWIERVEEARRGFATVIGASADEIAIVSCASEGTYQVASGTVWGRRGTIVTSDLEFLDFKVTDVEDAIEQLLALGATKPDFQPGEGQWTVLADPEGHLFCITAE